MSSEFIFKPNNADKNRHTRITMEKSVIVNAEKRPSNIAIFFACMFTILGVGLTIVYCSGILGGMKNTANLPVEIPYWLTLAIPPVVFFHQALALFLTLKQNVYTESGRMVRTWTWVFQVALFLMMCFTPYLAFHNQPIASYVMSTVTAALALGATVLTYRQTIAGGVVMSILFVVLSLIMIYLGYWAFA